MEKDGEILVASEELVNTGAGSSGESIFSGFGSCESDLNTPAGSEMDSTETRESDEDEFIAELTRQMAENMLQEDDEQLSRHGLRLVSTTPTSVLPNPTQIYSNQAFADQYHQRQQKQSKKHHHQVQNREYGNGRRAGFPNALPTGPGMRVVFLGGAGSRSGSSGTGVFLPTNNSADHQQSRKKQGCSTVLIPERVLQTLRHHFENRAARTKSNDGLHAQQNQRLQSHEMPQGINQESLQLPQEWTY